MITQPKLPKTAKEIYTMANPKTNPETTSQPTQELVARDFWGEAPKSSVIGLSDLEGHIIKIVGIKRGLGRFGPCWELKALLPDANEYAAINVSLQALDEKGEPGSRDRFFMKVEEFLRNGLDVPEMLVVSRPTSFGNPFMMLVEPGSQAPRPAQLSQTKNERDVDDIPF